MSRVLLAIVYTCSVLNSPLSGSCLVLFFVSSCVHVGRSSATSGISVQPVSSVAQESRSSCHLTRAVSLVLLDICRYKTVADNARMVRLFGLAILMAEDVPAAIAAAAYTQPCLLHHSLVRAENAELPTLFDPDGAGHGALIVMGMV
jgi:hypothetical protein